MLDTTKNESIHEICKFWAKSLALIYILPAEKRIAATVAAGIPDYLFKEPQEVLLRIYTTKELITYYMNELETDLLLQPSMREEYQANFLVRFMRTITWQSLEKYIETSVQNKGVLAKRPFWFRNFMKPSMNTYIHICILRIVTARLEVEKLVKEWNP